MKSRIFFTLIILAGYSSAWGQKLGENSTEKYFESIKNNAKELSSFLHAMPKGGELHDHLGGAGMAENMIRYAKGEHFCVDKQSYGVKINTNCNGDALLDNAEKNPTLYNAIIDAWSLRNFKPGKENAHDHCFAAFGKFSPIVPLHSAEILTEMAERAADQNELYMEVMITPDENASGILGKKVGWNSDFAIMRKKLFDNNLKNIVTDISKKLDAIETKSKILQHCDDKIPHPSCHIKIHYLYQVYREQAPEQVFAQLLAGFEAANTDKRIVGINMVQAENGVIAMRDYDLHMHMVEFLHNLYPQVHISLHAGESGPEIAPPEALRFHIRDAIEIGRAERIGHGLDIQFEDLPNQLMREMVRYHILVETTPSTEKILGFEQKDIPFQLYLDNNVPVAISTDDEGVMRTNLTEQFVDIVNTYSPSYLTLKKLVRNSIAYSFATGNTLWSDYDYRLVVPDCAHEVLGNKTPTSLCQRYLTANEKANLQWELEGQFAEFEKKYA